MAYNPATPGGNLVIHSRDRVLDRACFSIIVTVATGALIGAVLPDPPTVERPTVVLSTTTTPAPEASVPNPFDRPDDKYNFCYFQTYGIRCLSSWKLRMDSATLSWPTFQEQRSALLRDGVSNWPPRSDMRCQRPPCGP